MKFCWFVAVVTMVAMPMSVVGFSGLGLSVKAVQMAPEERKAAFVTCRHRGLKKPERW